MTYADLWPGIRLVTTWTGGSCGIALDKLREKLPSRAVVMELGYQSTECRGTIALEPETSGGLPPLHHHFFEFVEQDAWDHDTPEFLTLDQLEAGRRYYMLITTASGLYRYFMNDLVEVTGFFQQTPLLRFVQKGKGFTSLTGEKLYEGQTIDAIRETTTRYGLSPGFFLLVADEAVSAYRLFIELEGDGRPDAREIGAAVDARLGELNIEYHAKRESGRLGPLTVAWLRRGTGEAYKAAGVRAGQREGQFKPRVLQYRKEIALPVEQYAGSVGDASAHRHSSTAAEGAPHPVQGGLSARIGRAGRDIQCVGRGRFEHGHHRLRRVMSTAVRHRRVDRIGAHVHGGARGGAL